MGLLQTLFSRRGLLPLLLLLILSLVYFLPTSSSSSLEVPKWALLGKQEASGESAWGWGGSSGVHGTSLVEDDLDSSTDDGPGLNGLLAYRQHLELTTSPSGYSHSATLGFSHIYCISLATAQDRRQRMEKLAKALGVELTFVDAMSPTAPILRWIAERVVEVREKKIKVLVTSRKMAAGEIGGGGVGSPWLLGREELRADGLKEERLDGRDWVTYLEEEEDSHPAYFEGDGAVRLDLDSWIAKSLYDLRARKDEQLNAATLATWKSHISALQLMKRNGDQDALILEDDVDWEWDLARLWASAKRRLPEVGLLLALFLQDATDVQLSLGLGLSLPRALLGARAGQTRLPPPLASPSHSTSLPTRLRRLSPRSQLSSRRALRPLARLPSTSRRRSRCARRPRVAQLVQPSTAARYPVEGHLLRDITGYH